MKLVLLSAAATAALLLAGASYAQDPSNSDPNASTQPSTQPQTQPQDSPSAPSAPAQGSNASANTNVTVVTNGPIPDTPENRARFKPLSATGRATKPTGN